MELDEIKKIWDDLNSQLAKVEITNERIITEILKTKSTKSISKLANYDVIGTVLVFTTIALCICFWIFLPLLDLTKSFLAVVLPFAGLTGLWQIFKVMRLSKFNIENSIKDNLKKITFYQLMIKYERICMIFVMPVLFAAILFTNWRLGLLAYFWPILAIVMVIATFTTIYSYKKIERRINSVKESLDELKDLNK